MAETLEDSAHTSIAARLGDLRGQPFIAVNAPLVPAQKLTAQGNPKAHATAQGATLLPSLPRQEKDTHFNFALDYQLVQI